MKTEHEFNTRFTAEIKKMGTSIKVLKMSDRFRLGVSDWLIFYKGKAVAIEAKFAKELKKKGNVLTHKFSGAQSSFMKSMGLAGVCGYLLVYVADLGKMALIPHYRVPEDGQLQWEQLMSDEFDYRWYCWNEIDVLIWYAFGGIPYVG